MAGIALTDCMQWQEAHSVVYFPAPGTVRHTCVQTLQACV